MNSRYTAIRKPRPILFIRVERKDYIRRYTMTINRQPNFTYTVYADDVNAVIEFAKVMKQGIYGIMVSTGFISEDEEIENKLLCYDLRILQDK